MPERVVVLDFGAQYNQLIVRRVREAGVFSELLPYHAPLARIRGEALSGIILSGGPDSAYRRMPKGAILACFRSACRCLGYVMGCS